VEQALKDWAFYVKSGGGITLGGGEPVAQAEFAGAVLKKCKQKGLHTAVETSGHVPWPKMERLLPCTDLFLYDLKHMDSGRHREMTGADNRLILANLEEIVRRKGEVVVRVPVIPAFNDTEKQILAIARYAAKLGVREMHLLPYHRFGVGKYALLGRDYPLKGLKALDDEQTEALRRAGSCAGLEVKLHG
jgi:pyruvate formate lyase activating enzyme